jgi:hypothetical protein
MYTKAGISPRHSGLRGNAKIKHILVGRVFRREWEVLAVEFSHNDKFLQYINGLVPPNAATSSAPEPCGPSAAGS